MPKKEIKAQPELNIGLVGHVDHGKTTLTEQLSGKWTDTHSEEIKRGITIRLGYANTVFVKTKEGDYTSELKAKKQNKEYTVLRNVSFVDAPGHESLMATMLSGATIMDGALLLIAANEKCPQPQTREHLMALKICGIKNIVVVQNKIDLISEEETLNNYKEIIEFLKNTEYKDAPIIPVSAQLGINMSPLIEAIEKYIPTPKRSEKLDPIMFVARSFDINKPGQDIKKLKGGVLGGALKQGKIKLDDKIEIRPGHVYEEANKKVWKPLVTKVLGLMTGNTPVDEVGQGGSVGVLTLLDPSIVKSDRLTGNVVGHVGKLPPVWDALKLEPNLLERVVGSKEDLKVEAIKLNELLMLNVNSAATVGIVTKIGKNLVECKLKLPVCADKNDRITISRRIGTRFRLIGYGVIKE
ncbi:translation initiation factor IF-2 subunit gamma [Candidatus Woesearchaeota archaeon]|nr:translation initiation factor IF-2 subunit gamma [Candidatus Woesearchaeota archaeon]